MQSTHPSAKGAGPSASSTKAGKQMIDYTVYVKWVSSLELLCKHISDFDKIVLISAYVYMWI